MGAIKLWFSTYENYLKVAVILLYTVFIWHCHSIYDTSKEVVIAQHQVIKSDKATNNVIKFNQKVTSLHVKDPCFNTLVPDELNSLLK